MIVHMGNNGGRNKKRINVDRRFGQWFDRIGKWGEKKLMCIKCYPRHLC